ncbi:MAG: hypothetical protein RMK19_05550, partial [Bacteroidia bacterium]|nr:hypothetical protein [Bacteroidia bacterium]
MQEERKGLSSLRRERRLRRAELYPGVVRAQLNGRLVQFDIPAVVSFTDPPALSLSGTTYVGQDTFTLALQFRVPTSRSDTSYTVSGEQRGAHLQIQYRGRTNSDIYVAPYSARNRFARLSMEEIRINGNLVQGKFSGVAYNTELASTVDSIRVTAG